MKLNRYFICTLASGILSLGSLLCVADQVIAEIPRISPKIKPQDLECVTRGDLTVIRRKGGVRLWGRISRAEPGLLRELKKLNTLLGRSRSPDARVLRAQRRDLELMLQQLRACTRQTVPGVTPTASATPPPASATPTLIPPTLEPTATLIPSKVPVFIAQGHAGRLIMSCDDGQTWINNTDQTVSSAVRCWNNVNITVGPDVEVVGCTDSSCDDCDHQNWAGRGIAYGDGAFVVTWGWGKPGKVQRSTDGVHWATVLNATTHADLSYGNGVFMTGRGRPYFSQDNGITWSLVTVPNGYDEYYNVRGIGFGSSPLGGRFFTYGDGDRVRTIPYTGASISTPVYDQGCGSAMVGSATNNTVMVTSHSEWNPPQAYTCRSINGGQSWVRQNVPNTTLATGIFWTGSEFVFWGDNSRMYRSADGVTWTFQNLIAENFTQFPHFGPIARSDSGAFVMIKGDWGQWYEQQRFYRSTDGVHWRQLAAGSYVGSHPMNFIEFGYVDPVVGGCPVR